MTMMDFTKPLSELTPAEVASEMARLRLRDAELDREMAESAARIERLKAFKEPSIGIYDPNASPGEAPKPSSEDMALAKLLMEVDLTLEQERLCASVESLFGAIF